MSVASDLLLFNQIWRRVETAYGIPNAKDFPFDLFTIKSGGVPAIRILNTGNGLTGGGDLTNDLTFNIGANPDGSIVTNANDIQVGVLATDAQHGLRGGGTQHSVASITVAGFMSPEDKAKLDAFPLASVSEERTITTGFGLTGGGDLSANRTINIGANQDGSITVNSDDIQVGVLATDGQHGVRGGGTQHALATTSSSGFMSSTDKTKLDGLVKGIAVFEAGERVVTVSNGLVTASSVIVPVMQTDDATAVINSVIPSDGSFNINLVVPCTGTTRVGWVIF